MKGVLNLVQSIEYRVLRFWGDSFEMSSLFQITGNCQEI